jgi:hypothetical protein
VPLRAWWYSWLPWLKLKRATLMPACSSSCSCGTVRLLGPSVQMMCVFFGSSEFVPLSAALGTVPSRGC